MNYRQKIINDLERVRRNKNLGAEYAALVLSGPIPAWVEDAGTGCPWWKGDDAKRLHLELRNMILEEIVSRRWHSGK